MSRKSIIPKRFYDGMKRFESKRKGWATYIDKAGVVRSCDNIKAGAAISIPLDHIERVRKQR